MYLLQRFVKQKENNKDQTKMKIEVAATNYLRLIQPKLYDGVEPFICEIINFRRFDWWSI